MLAAASWDTTMTLWDPATGRKLRTLQNATLLASVMFSPDGRRLATGDTEGAVKLWDVATGREILTLGRLTLDTRVAFSPDGRRLAAGSLSGWRLWEAASKEEVAAREAREGETAAPPGR
jgi:WD40 repeat protein